MNEALNIVLARYRYEEYVCTTHLYVPYNMKHKKFRFKANNITVV